ncbi:MAG: hypothetical protein CVU31_07545 [Betaproteobacteria bacterium HGW-Betaproteobacteria-4]|nr:MAG: hypothetical protein CVU31_07545 [Betaproteobacteria bacterium HGW-Betaproteobacteria-4]
MTRLLGWLAGTLFLLVLAAGGLLLAALDSTPLVERSETISQAAVNQARWLFHTNDPRRLQSGEARRTAIPAALIDEGINYLAGRSLHGRGALVLGEETAEIRVSRRLPWLPGEPYLNLRATFREGNGEPKIVAAAIGWLPIPPGLLEFALASAIQAAGYGPEWRLARQAVRQLIFDPQHRRVVVAYVWEPALLDRARSIAFQPDDLVRIRSAQESLAALLDHHAPGRPVPLTDVLRPLLDIDGADQRENRRAALLVLGIYLAEKNIASLIPEARNWPQLRPVALMLAGRNDSAQSFADLAADRAGTRFGELLSRADGRLDALVDTSFSDSDLIPPIGDLPESISTAEFRRRFGNTGSPAYRQLTAEIERRLDALPLYKPE